MLFQTQSFETAQIAQEVTALCKRSRGPAIIRRDLAAWASRFGAADPSSATVDALKFAIGALLVLSFANSAYRVSSVNRGYPPKRDVEVEDLGGAFPALYLASALVETAEDQGLRAELERFIWSENDRIASQIMARLPL